MATTAFGSDREGHGWMGVRFRESGNAEPSELIIHVRLLDNQAVAQQYVLAVLGTNILHACYFRRDDHVTFVEAIIESVSIAS